MPPPPSRFARLHQSAWSAWAHRRHRARFEEVETFCLFVGYPRSGHSLVGAALNAHRHAVIAHELDTGALVLAGCDRETLFARILARAAWFHLRGDTSNYRYEVPGQWQGRFERLRVVGDKFGGLAAQAVHDHPDLLDRLAAVVRVPVRLVHVVRNPYDNIAAISLWHQLSLDEASDWYFRLCRTCARLTGADAGGALTLHHEEWIRSPQEQLRRLCTALGLEADADYLAACASVTAEAPSYTRRRVSWGAKQVADIARRAAAFPFLAPYAFEIEDEASHERSPSQRRAPPGTLWSRAVLRFFPTERPPRAFAGAHVTPRAPAAATLSQSLYWNQTSGRIADEKPLVAWRAYMAGVYRRLLRDWLPAQGGGVRLKTDLFEEAVSGSHPFDDLGGTAVGIDVSYAVARRARKRLGPRANCLVADLRALPFADRSVAHILSGSSLDHFVERAELRAGLAELSRVLAAGGTLVLTLDNPHNPVVRLRNLLPYRLLEAARLVPYYVGATLGRTEAEAELRGVGLRVAETRTVGHAPRAAAIWLERLLERFGGAGDRLTAAWDLTERLARWPSRDLTGYYLAFRAERVAAGEPASARATSGAQAAVDFAAVEPSRRTA